MNNQICCICGKQFVGYRNNPSPIKNDGMCCDKCNAEVVVPARIKLLRAMDNVSQA